MLKIDSKRLKSIKNIILYIFYKTMSKYWCDYCDYQTNFPSNFSRHTNSNRHHKNIQAETAICPQMPANLQTKPAKNDSISNIKQHFECPYCAVVYTRKYNLNQQFCYDFY